MSEPETKTPRESEARESEAPKESWQQAHERLGCTHPPGCLSCNWCGYEMPRQEMIAEIEALRDRLDLLASGINLANRSIQNLQTQLKEIVARLETFNIPLRRKGAPPQAVFQGIGGIGVIGLPSTSVTEQNVKILCHPYQIINTSEGGAIGITCLLCNKTSFNPNDVSNHYCGHCHKYLDDL